MPMEMAHCLGPSLSNKESKRGVLSRCVRSFSGACGFARESFFLLPSHLNKGRKEEMNVSHWV